jgi:hypothetical protein
MQRNLTYGCKTVRVMNATAAGTSTVNGSSVDCLGYEGVRFVCLLNTLTATQVTSMKIQGSLDGATNWTDMGPSSTGNAADADSNKLLISEIFRPNTFRYLRPVVVRGTANAALDGVIAELFLARVEPVTQDATVSQAVVNAYIGAGTP